MILSRSFIEFVIVNANSPTSSSTRGDHIPIASFDHGHCSLFWDHMNGTNPSTVRNGVEDASLK